MPWTPKDAYRHTHKATSPTAQRQWSHVADSALSHGASEGSAIRQANSVVARRHYDGGGPVLHPRQSLADAVARQAAVPSAGADRAAQQAYLDRARVSVGDTLASELRARAILDALGNPPSPPPQAKAAGGYISPLSSIAGNPMAPRATLPKYGNPMGTAGRMRMPKIPLMSTLHNIDQHIGGARAKLPKLKAKLRAGGPAAKAAKAAFSQLANRDASSASATLRASPAAMRNPAVRGAAHSLRTGQNMAPAMRAVAGLANQNTNDDEPPP